MDRQENLKQLLGPEMVSKFNKQKVLVVGAGGIGCELLKNLVLSGFHNLEIIDLDTIDLSNLNRQFLFQKEHIKKPKALVARESVLRFNPDATIIAHHDTIYNQKYDLKWFQSFKLVLNALDNIGARRHVNKMCLAANVPLIESGTAGYHGQVSVHAKGFKCYECDPKQIEQKTYPVCTIRSTPSAPVHCIVWANNYLFNALFGKLEEEELEATPENEVENVKRENQNLLRMRSALGTDSAHSRIFESVFINDIKMLKSMKDLWKTRKEPILLDHKNLESLVKQLKPLDQSSIEFDQTVWDIAQNYKVFQTSLDEISKDLIKQRKRDPNLWFTFDKDDERFLNFVTATSNLRAHIFGIELKSRFAVKEIAGNIIPAIATTNAIVAGMIVMLAFKILMDQINECNYTFVAYGGDRTHLLMNEGLSKPNPQCVVCSNSYFMAKLNLDQTLETLVTAIQSDLHLKGEITIQNGEQLLYDVEFDDNLQSSLKSLDVKNGSQLTVTNDDDEPENNFSVVIFISPWSKKSIEFIGDKKLKSRPRPAEQVDFAEPSPFKRIKESVIEIDEMSLAPISVD